MVERRAALGEAVAALAALDATLRLIFGPGAVERQPVRLDPLAGDAATFDQTPLDLRLDLDRAPTVLGRLRKRFEHGLTPRDMRLAHRSELTQQAHGRR